MMDIEVDFDGEGSQVCDVFYVQPRGLQGW